MSNTPRTDAPTESMLISVHGVLQVLRNTPGATYGDVVQHCFMRGDAIDSWPAWIMNQEGYVTELDAAEMIYAIMESARKKEK